MTHIIKANTYPISNNSENALETVKNIFFKRGVDHLNVLDANTMNELNALCHPNILLYNIVRNEYIFKRFITVLLHNFGHDHGRNFSENLDKVENVKLVEFIEEIYKVANVTFVDESTKKIFLRIKFVGKGFKSQVVDYNIRANFEYDVLKKISVNSTGVQYSNEKCQSANMFDWLKGKTLLDVGCGPGHFLGELVLNNHVDRHCAHGIDIASYINVKYKDLFIVHSYDNSMKFPSTLPQIDFISFFMSIHHIQLYKLHLILLQLYSMLSPNGFLYIKDHLVECQDDVTFFKFMETYFYFVEEYIPNVPVEDNYFTRIGMKEVFEIYGFELVDHFEINKNHPFKPFYYIFKKNPSYIETIVTEEEKLTTLRNVVATMRVTNTFTNGNLYVHTELNDFRPISEETNLWNILHAELEKTESQINKAKFERTDV